MSRLGTKRRLQRKQARRKSAVSCKSAECLLWFVGESTGNTLWSNHLEPPGCLRGASAALCVLGCGGLEGSAGGTSGLAFRSKVISDMLVVLFIGGRDLFPNNIFFLRLLLLDHLTTFAGSSIGKKTGVAWERGTKKVSEGENSGALGDKGIGPKSRSESGPLIKRLEWGHH